MAERLAGFDPCRAGAGPEDRETGSGQRIGDTSGQRRLGSDHDQFDGFTSGDRHDRRPIEGVNAGHAPDARLGRDGVTAGRDDDRVDARLGGQFPGQRMFAPATPHDQDPGGHHEAHAGRAGRWRIGRQARSIVWVRSGPTDTRTIGTPACSSIADT